MLEIRGFTPADEPSWLRCRVLAFLSTSYFDDVATEKPRYPDGIELVAVRDDTVVGILDVAFADDLATIECVAVHPDHARRGIATRLFEEALPRVRERGVPLLDAWTRVDVPALSWYAARGFVERYRYLHVHAERDELADAVTGRPGLAPMSAFLHARIDDEAAVREQFARVYTCRRFVLDVATTT